MAVYKGVAIDDLRLHLETLPPQTQLRNAVASLTIDQASGSAYRSYIEWLSAVARKLGLESVCGLEARLAEVSPTRTVGNVEGTTHTPYVYRVSARKNRDPWREIRVKTVKIVLDRVVDDVVSPTCMAFGRRSFDDVFSYIENRALALTSRHDIALGQLVQPVAEVVAVAISTNVEHVRVQTRTWTGAESKSRPKHLVGGRSWKEVIEQLGRTIKENGSRGIPVLIAINAPLGWPMRMIEALTEHRAGLDLPRLDIDANDPEERWRDERNRFFRRETEQVVRREGIGRWGDGRRKFGPSGLDVGADKSARTAHTALRLLKALREWTNLAIPVVTDDCGPITRASAIEVYTSWRRTPAEDAPDRRDLDVEPQGDQGEAVGAETMEYDRQVDNARNAARAAVAFLERRVVHPHDENVSDEVAEKEGWIWFSRRWWE